MHAARHNGALFSLRYALIADTPRMRATVVRNKSQPRHSAHKASKTPLTIAFFTTYTKYKNIRLIKAMRSFTFDKNYIIVLRKIQMKFTDKMQAAQSTNNLLWIQKKIILFVLLTVIIIANSFFTMWLNNCHFHGFTSESVGKISLFIRKLFGGFCGVYFLLSRSHRRRCRRSNGQTSFLNCALCGFEWRTNREGKKMTDVEFLPLGILLCVWREVGAHWTMTDCRPSDDVEWVRSGDMARRVFVLFFCLFIHSWGEWFIKIYSEQKFEEQIAFKVNELFLRNKWK